MTQINLLTAVDTPSQSDQVPIYSAANGDARRTSFTAIAALMAQLNPPQDVSGLFPQYLTQYSSPSSAGFTLQINDTDDNTWLILTPTATLASGTIKLPAVANVIHGQELLCNTTQQITALTVDGNGATAVTGEPTSLAADAFFRLRFDLVTKIWYRVG